MRSSRFFRSVRVRPGDGETSPTLGGRRRASFCRCVAVLGAIAAVWPIDAAHAADPERALSQYIRDRWDRSAGFVGGHVYAITQTRDGYLWVAAEKGHVTSGRRDQNEMTEPGTLPGDRPQATSSPTRPAVTNRRMAVWTSSLFRIVSDPYGFVWK